MSVDRKKKTKGHFLPCRQKRLLLRYIDNALLLSTSVIPPFPPFLLSCSEDTEGQGGGGKKEEKGAAEEKESHWELVAP